MTRLRDVDGGVGLDDLDVCQDTTPKFLPIGFGVEPLFPLKCIHEPVCPHGWGTRGLRWGGMARARAPLVLLVASWVGHEVQY